MSETCLLGDRPSHRLRPPGSAELRRAVGPTEAVGRRVTGGGRGGGVDAPAAPLAVLKMDCEEAVNSVSSHL